MSARRPDERLGPLTGGAAAVLWLVGLFTLEGVSNPGDAASPAEALAYFDDEPAAIYVGVLAIFAASMLLIWFAATLRAAVARAEDVARLASIVFGAAVAKAIFDAAAVAPYLAGTHAASQSEDSLTPDAAQALFFAGDGFGVAAEWAAALFLAAVAVAVFRFRILPRGLGWAAAAIAVLLLIVPVGWVGLVFGFPIWLVVTSIALVRGRSPAAEPAARGPAT